MNVSYNSGIQWALRLFGWDGLQDFEAVRCNLSENKDFIDTFVECAERLEVLDASENPFEDHLSIVEHLLVKCQRLRTLNLGCTTISDVDMKEACQGPAERPLRLISDSIVRLEFSGIVRGSEQSSLLVEMLRDSILPNLKALILNKNTLTS